MTTNGYTASHISGGVAVWFATNPNIGNVAYAVRIFPTMAAAIAWMGR
jgi:hypothetical protein